MESRRTHLFAIRNLSRIPSSKIGPFTSDAKALDRNCPCGQVRLHPNVTKLSPRKDSGPNESLREGPSFFPERTFSLATASVAA